MVLYYMVQTSGDYMSTETNMDHKGAEQQSLDLKA